MAHSEKPIARNVEPVNGTRSSIDSQRQLPDPRGVLFFRAPVRPVCQEHPNLHWFGIAAIDNDAG